MQNVGLPYCCPHCLKLFKGTEPRKAMEKHVRACAQRKINKKPVGASVQQQLFKDN